MKTILRNISRMFFDDGRGDRDFSDQERRLNDALSYLQESTKGLTKAAEILSDLIKRALNHASADRVWHKLAKTDAGMPINARLCDQSKPYQPSTYPMPSSGIIWNFQAATVIGLPCPATITMRTGSAGKQGNAGKSRQELAAQLMRQAGCDCRGFAATCRGFREAAGSRSACLVSACVVSALSNVGLQNSTVDLGRPSKHPATCPPLASRLVELDLSEIPQGVPRRAHDRRAFARIQKAIKKMMKRMSKEAYDDLAAELVEDVDEFRWQRDQEKH